MYVSKIKNRYSRLRKRRICQGDILQNISFVMRIDGLSNEQDEISIPYGVVMSQDCDVDVDFLSRTKEQDVYKQGLTEDEIKERLQPLHDKFLPTILICPAYLADSFFAGEHIDGWYIKPKNTGQVKKIKANNEMNRYHYLPKNTDLGINDMVIDFKHFFTVPVDILYKQRKEGYVATVSELFREDLSQRFANYLSRFGLPEIP